MGIPYYSFMQLRIQRHYDKETGSPKEIAVKKNLVIPFLILPMVLALAACTDDDSDLPRLEFHDDMTEEITVGDTTDPIVVTKFSATVQGRETKEESYLNFTLESSDTSVVKVVLDRQLVGVKAGTSKVTALDKITDARTKGSVTVTVVATP